MKPLSCLFFFLLTLMPTNCLATAGMAEWELASPGGNTVAHSDPWKEKHSTFILKGAPSTARSGIESEVLVSQVEWWAFIPDFILGKCAKGFFLLNEKNQSVVYFETEKQFNSELAVRKLSIFKRMFPQDGWNEVWIAAPCKLGEKHPALNEATDSSSREARRTAIKTQCENAGFAFGK